MTPKIGTKGGPPFSRDLYYDTPAPHGQRKRVALRFPTSHGDVFLTVDLQLAREGGSRPALYSLHKGPSSIPPFTDLSGPQASAVIGPPVCIKFSKAQVYREKQGEMCRFLEALEDEQFSAEAAESQAGERDDDCGSADDVPIKERHAHNGGARGSARGGGGGGAAASRRSRTGGGSSGGGGGGGECACGKRKAHEVSNLDVEQRAELNCLLIDVARFVGNADRYSADVKGVLLDCLGWLT